MKWHVILENRDLSRAIFTNIRSQLSWSISFKCKWMERYRIRIFYQLHTVQWSISYQFGFYFLNELLFLLDSRVVFSNQILKIFHVSVKTRFSFTFVNIRIRCSLGVTIYLPDKICLSALMNSSITSGDSFPFLLGCGNIFVRCDRRSLAEFSLTFRKSTRENFRSKKNLFHSIKKDRSTSVSSYRLSLTDISKRYFSNRRWMRRNFFFKRKETRERFIFILAGRIRYAWEQSFSNKLK